MVQKDVPLIVAFVSDLYFASRIDSIAQKMGYRAQFIERSEELMSLAPNGALNPGVESIEGMGLLDFITRIHPVLIFFDLNNQDVPWGDWITLLKTSPASRRIPVVCFGSHRNVADFTTAKSAGADAVFARSQFVDTLGTIIQSFSRNIDFAALGNTCQELLSITALHGLELFNRGEYFDAHEILEEAWNQDDTQGKELYRAILQVAVTYYQIERGNYRGAMKMFLRLRQWIDPLPDRCRGVDISRLRQDVQQVYEHLVNLGETRIQEFDRRLFKPIQFVTAS